VAEIDILLAKIDASMPVDSLMPLPPLVLAWKS
jgi:hypothetical protein